jgi:hypothetical protein
MQYRSDFQEKINSVAVIEKGASILFRISVAIWIISLIIHLLSVFQVDLLTKLPWLVYIQILAFALLMASILYIKSKNTGSKNKLAWLIDPVPTFLIFLSFAGLPYCFANVFIAAGLHGSPRISEYDGFVLDTKRGVKLISREEYHYYQALSLRILSSAGLAMSGIASFLFYPRIKK